MEKQASVRLTKTLVDNLEPIEGKFQTFYRDNLLKGFALRITSNGVKSFVVETRINRRVKRKTLGKYGNLTTEEARKLAKDFLGKVAMGYDPIAAKKTKLIKGITLRDVFKDYFKARKDLKPRTKKDYENVFGEVFPDWWDKPINTITQEMIAKRHNKHGLNHSKARANNAMRVLRALFNFAMFEYLAEDGKPIITINPVKYLSHTRAWFRIERKQTVIKPHQLKNWYNGVLGLLEVETYRNAMLWHDYFLLLLFTGIRKTEGASLRWEDIDLLNKSITLKDTKNRENHILPIPDFIYQHLERRSQSKTSEFVFPANSESGYISEPQKAILKITELSGVPFSLHDLRRTFATIADNIDLPAYALKRLLNHKMHHDVTAGYIMHDVERLRKPMEEIADFLLKHMKGDSTPYSTVTGNISQYEI